jgi:segregation and condensation protein A
MQLLHSREVASSNEQLLQLILKEDELSWQQIIYDLVRKEEMDPWDIDLKTLTGRFLAVIKTLQRMDFRVSGKLVLAAAVLLKIKSNRLLDEDLLALDHLISSAEDEEPIDLLAYEEELIEEEAREQRPRIYPRTPRPRQRKVSVYDLVTALEQALEVSVRRDQRALDRVQVEAVVIPEKKIDVSKAMNNLLERIAAKEGDRLRFLQLLESADKNHIVYTFIPLLHLTNERRIDLEQKEHFGDILITLLDATPIQATDQEV